MNTFQLPILRSHSAGDLLQGVVYFGEREGWHIALSTHRDAGALTRSNWDVITRDVLNVPNDWHDCPGGHTDACRCPAEAYGDGLTDAAIERFSNDLCGWTEHLIVRPGSSAERRAIEWLEKLENYPVADEDHYSALEYSEEWCVRCDRGSREDHSRPEFQAAYPCKFRSEEDAEEILYRWRSR